MENAYFNAVKQAFHVKINLKLIGVKSPVNSFNLQIETVKGSI